MYDLIALATAFTESVTLAQQLASQNPNAQPLLDKLLAGQASLERTQNLFERFKKETAAYATLLRLQDEIAAGM